MVYELKSRIQIISSIFSFFFNFLAIYLIITKSPKSMGTYKILMIYFSILSIILSITEITLQPYTISIEMCTVLFSDEKVFFKVGALNFATGSCAAILPIFPIHFVFRYWSIQKSPKLEYFHGFYLICWLLVPIFVGGIWGIIVGVIFGQNDVTTEFIRGPIESKFEISMKSIEYIAVHVTSFDSSDYFENLKYLVASSFIAVVMIISAIIVVFYGIKIYFAIGDLILAGESDYTRNLQKQFYKALLVQTCLPVLCVFFPIGAAYFLPILDIDINTFSEVSMSIYSIYPAIDPIPTIIFISNYRNAVLDFCFCRDEKRVAPEINVVNN